jgi:hypothetical protein
VVIHHVLEKSIWGVVVQHHKYAIFVGLIVDQVLRKGLLEMLQAASTGRNKCYTRERHG